MSTPIDPGTAANSPEPNPDPLEAARRALISEPPDRALAAAEHAAAAAGDDPRNAAYAHQLRSRALRMLGRHLEALTAFAEAAASAERAGDIRLAAQVRIGEIDSLGMLGRFDAAETLAHRLADVLSDAGAPADAAKALGNLGSLHLRRDRYEEALNAYAQAAALLGPDAEPLLRAGLAINEGIALTYLGRAGEAQARYDTARAIYRDSGRPFDAAVVAADIGFLHQVSGRYADALAEYAGAYRTFAAEGREHEAARSDIDTADAYRALNLLAEAASCYERARTVFERLPLDYDRARASLGLAAVAVRQGRLSDAAGALSAAETVFRRQKNRISVAHCRLLRADLLLRQGSREAAEAEAQGAVRAFRRGGLEDWAAEARLTALRCRPDGVSLPSLSRSLQAIAATARRTARGWLECRAEAELARIRAHEGKRASALRHWRAAIAALETVRTRVAPEDLHTAFLADKETIYGEAAAYLLEGAPDAEAIAEALDILERSRSRLLLERLLSAHAEAAGGGEGRAADTALWRRLADLRAELVRAYSAVLGPAEEEPRRHGVPTLSAERLAQLESDYARALRAADLADFIPQAAFTREPPEIAALQSALDTNETLLVYGVLGDSVAAFVVGRDGIAATPRLAACADVRYVLRRFRYHLQKMEMAPDLRAALADEMRAEMDEVLERLHGLLICPIRSRLTGSRLVVVPGGLLHGLPFHAFRDGDGYLLDRFEIRYAPSTSVWHTLTAPQTAGAQEERPPGGKPLIVGHAGPGVKQVSAEVAAIGRLLPQARLLRDSDATVGAVLGAARDAPLLHLATHALFRRDNPLFSGLQLDDGWLFARDLYGVRLAAETVVLSACETAAARVEPGDEWMGLARGFLAAGARRVVASLWPADDAATAELMERFYTFLAGGSATAAALGTAQRELRAARPHPYYWAAFSLIGAR